MTSVSWIDLNAVESVSNDPSSTLLSWVNASMACCGAGESPGRSRRFPCSVPDAFQMHAPRSKEKRPPHKSRISSVPLLDIPIYPTEYFSWGYGLKWRP